MSILAMAFRIASACIVLGAADAHADMTFSQAYFYGARYTVDGPRDKGAGYTGGAYLSFDWNQPASTTSTHLGLISELQFGMGYMPGTAIGIDLIADILGIGGRLEISEDFQVGFFFEPAELYATPIGGYIGSKLMLKAAFRQLQLEVGRGGNGIFYGWLLPKDDQSLQIATLQYLGGGNRTFGVRFLRGPDGDNVGMGVMACIGWWL